MRLHKVRRGKSQRDCVAQRMALRIAQHALAMGLDDEDERCLWGYVHMVWSEDRDRCLEIIPDEVRSVLIDQAQLMALVRLPTRWVGKMPDKFVRQGALSRVGIRRKLTYNKKLPVLMPLLIIEKDFALHEDLARTFSESLLQKWYSDVVAWRDPETGRLVEPSSSDIVVDTNVKMFDLYKVLGGDTGYIEININ